MPHSRIRVLDSRSRLLATAIFLVIVTLMGTMLAPGRVAAAEPTVRDGEIVSHDLVRPMSLDGFDPGNIISDAVFFNRNSMSEAQIQAFLESKVRSCASGNTCLKDYVDTTRAVAANAMCGAYPGGGRERASTIIYRVAQACGINPQAILVMLEKEQGLVRHTDPSATRYRIAMGQGCPDTAACDTRYYGFFNQVMGAAWQLKRYGNPPGTSQYFTWYPVGRVSNVQYHPNAGCGSSPVLIQNQATAALYYYTPYQPNAAALRAGVGEGDGCSAYGNRNFYNFFTDWFGSTRAVGIILSVGNDIYLASGGKRFHIPPHAWPEFRRAYGSPTPVSELYLAQYSDGGVASLYVRNTSTGAISYLDNAQLHYFDSCELIAVWGGACARVTDMSATDLARLPVGGSMTTFGRLSAGGPVHQMSGARLVRMYDDTVAATFNAGRVPYAAVLPGSVVSNYTVAPLTRFATARFIQFAGESRVWLPTSDGRLVYLPSWARAAEFGLETNVLSTGVPTSAAMNWTQIGDLELVVSCGTNTYFAASGSLHPVTSTAVSGFRSTAIDAATCERLRLANEPAGLVFVQKKGSSAIYVAEAGVYRHVQTIEQLQQLSGAVTARVLQVSSETFERLPVGSPYLAVGTMVKTASKNAVYWVDGGRLLHLPSWDLAHEGGLPTAPTVVSDAAIAGQRMGPVLTPFVRCAGTLRVAAGGTYSVVTAGDAGGNTVTDLDARTCSILPAAGAPIAGSVFVTDGTRWAYAARGGWVQTDQTGAVAANGGKTPDARAVSASYLSWLPAPRP